ncbi:GNAT family N-acetyltransferase [Streptomyces sp. NPDC020965]|uniref:GNAT family N-acetyltransferase n=1 Tax=Streptomyces sp. NPDC020965 TaxID=3365105 RepID=UPI0037B1375F
MTAATVRIDSGSGLLRYAEGIRAVYADAFTGPPWHEDPATADTYPARLSEDATRPGFTAALTVEGTTVLGFAVGWTTPDRLPADRCYPRVAAALGPDRTRSWLCGGREIDELAVHTGARGLGVGAALLAALTADAPAARSWLLTSAHADAALSFYRRLGWHQVTHPAPGGNGPVVFLGPGHPAAPPH